MFVCIECGRLFEAPQYWEERHNLDTPPYEQMSGCPFCGGAYVDAFPCDCCGDWITDNYFKTEDGERYCNNCVYHYEIGEE